MIRVKSIKIFDFKIKIIFRDEKKDHTLFDYLGL
jgi:hypothetical protein